MQLTLGHLTGEITPDLVKATPARRKLLEEALNGRRLPFIGETIGWRKRWVWPPENVKAVVTGLKFSRYRDIVTGDLTFPDEPDEGQWVLFVDLASGGTDHCLVCLPHYYLLE